MEHHYIMVHSDKKCYRRREKGQGLIEALIIVLFVGVSVVALLKFQHYLAYSSSIAHQQSDAAILAYSQMETLENFQVLNTTSGYTAYQNIASGSTTSTVGNTTYTLTWTVTPTATPTYKTINVAVSWTDIYGATQTINITSVAGSIDPSTPSTFM